MKESQSVMGSNASWTNDTSALNDSSENWLTWTVDCAADPPSSQELFYHMQKLGLLIYGFLLLCVVINIALYVDEIKFIRKNFRKQRARGRATIWILAFFPVFSATSFLGAVVPRAGTLVDVCSQAFFGSCLYQFVTLMSNYMGGVGRMRIIVGDDRHAKLMAPPCCCCCPCLGTFHFNRRTYLKLTLMVLQIAIVRPIIMFLAAVLWANGSYVPGMMSPYNGYTYITIMNLMSTLPAMYGLMLLRNALAPDLEENFHISGKISSIQLTMVSTLLIDAILGGLVTSGVIGCTAIFPSKARGEAIFHVVLVVLMVPYALIGRKYFRREIDGSQVADLPEGVELEVKEELDAEGHVVKAQIVIQHQPETSSYAPVNNNEVV